MADVVVDQDEQAVQENLELRHRFKGIITVNVDDVYDHPHQWRKHPKSQVAALRAALALVGQADLIIVYRCQKDLLDAKNNTIPAGSLVAIDGHGRKNQSGYKIWQALELDVNDEEAAFLLATLDPMSAMAVTEKERYAQLYDALPIQPEPLQMMLDGNLGVRMPGAGLEYNDEGDDETPEGAAAPEKVKGLMDIPQSTVRMAQLYMDTTTHPPFMEWTDKLKDVLGGENFTDTVYKAVRYAWTHLVVLQETPSSDDVTSPETSDEPPPPVSIAEYMARVGGEVSAPAQEQTESAEDGPEELNLGPMEYVCWPCETAWDVQDAEDGKCPTCGLPMELRAVPAEEVTP